MTTKNIFNKLILLVIMLCLFIVIGCKNNSTDPGGNGGDDDSKPKSFLELKDKYYYTENVDNIITASGKELSTSSNAPNIKNVTGKVYFYMKDNRIYMNRSGNMDFNIYMKVIEQVTYNGIIYQHNTM